MAILVLAVLFLFKLYYKEQSKEYINLEKDDSVIKITDSGLVKIHKMYLKRYLAVKNMALVMHIDSRCVDTNGENFPTDMLKYRNEENTICYTMTIGTYPDADGQRNFSLLIGKGTQ